MQFVPAVERFVRKCEEGEIVESNNGIQHWYHSPVVIFLPQ